MRIRVPPKRVRERFLIIYELEGCQKAVDFLTEHYEVRRMKIILDGRKVGNGNIAIYFQNRAYFTKKGLKKRTVLHEFYHHLVYVNRLETSARKEERAADCYAKDILTVEPHIVRACSRFGRSQKLKFTRRKLARAPESEITEKYTKQVGELQGYVNSLIAENMKLKEEMSRMKGDVKAMKELMPSIKEVVNWRKEIKVEEQLEKEIRKFHPYPPRGWREKRRNELRSDGRLQSLGDASKVR